MPESSETEMETETTFMEPETTTMVEPSETTAEEMDMESTSSGQSAIRILDEVIIKSFFCYHEWEKIRNI